MSWSLVQTVWIAIFTVKVTLRFKILQKWVFDGSFKPFATKVGLLFSRSQWGFESSVNLSCIFWNAVSLCYQTWYLIIWQRSFLSAFTTGSHTSRWLWELFVHGWFLHRCFRNMALKKKWDRVVSPVPNPQAGGPAVLILSVPSPAQTSPARLDLPGALEGSSQHSSGDQWGTLAILPQQGTSTRDGKIGMLVYHFTEWHEKSGLLKQSQGHGFRCSKQCMSVTYLLNLWKSNLVCWSNESDVEK